MARIPKYEFKPDPTGADPLRGLYLSTRQKHALIKWSFYCLVVLVSLVIQDTILGRIRISGATTDLAVCAIMLIGVMEGAENGGTFALFASLFYYFSGSAPGPYVIILLTAVVIGAALFLLKATGMTAHIIISVVGIAALIVYTVMTKKEWKLPPVEIGMRVAYGLALISGIVLNVSYISALAIAHKVLAALFVVGLIVTFVHKLATKNK